LFLFASCFLIGSFSWLLIGWRWNTSQSF
jgi:hypothetical protein